MNSGEHRGCTDSFCIAPCPFILWENGLTWGLQDVSQVSMKTQKCKNCYCQTIPKMTKILHGWFAYTKDSEEGHCFWLGRAHRLILCLIYTYTLPLPLQYSLKSASVESFRKHPDFHMFSRAWTWSFGGFFLAWVKYGLRACPSAGTLRTSPEMACFARSESPGLVLATSLDPTEPGL